MPDLAALAATGHRFTQDIKALGTSAPLRAVYEASKRCGGHTLLFREVRDRPSGGTRDIRLGTHVPESETAKARCLDDAQAVITRGARVFGRRAPTGIRTSWLTDPLTGKEWASDTPWWKIDIRTDSRLSDVKFIWEAGRHRDLVVLARAAALEPSGPWLRQLEESLGRWFLECEVERGVHWYSSLELALRAISWVQVLALVGHSLAPSTRFRMEKHLLASARHIMVELPYTLSSMKNNHLLGDGLGLVVLGQLFPAHPAANRWSRVGDTLFLKQLRRHMHLDGSMIEDSLSYHRFVLEMLIIRHLLGNAPNEVTEAMRAAALHLVDMGVLDGPVPQYGDWDEGRVLADSAPAGSVLGSTLLALSLSGHLVDPEAWALHDELSWYTTPAQSGKGIPSPTAAAVRAGYFIRARSGDYRVWLKVSGGRSHQHADITALWIRHGDNWIVEDPGTGTYNGPLQVRNGFRTSVAHDVWRPFGQDQLRPHRAFRWLHSAQGTTATPLYVGETTILFASHNAFVASDPTSRVARLVALTPHGVTVSDHVERPGAAPWQLNVPLGHDARSEDLFGIEGATSHCGNAEAFLGWHSPTYGTWNPSQWVSLQRDLQQPAVWGVGQNSIKEVLAEVTWSPSGALPRVTVDDQTHVLEVSDA